MKLRSMLFVPADSERKLAKSVASEADALILDLEDAVAEARKPVARGMAADFIGAQVATMKARLFVRVNPLDTPFVFDDLARVVRPGLAGIVLPKIRSALDIQRLSQMLDTLEARAGIAPGSVKVVPVATETPEIMLAMGSFAGLALPRLAAVTWGAEDLSAAVGAESNREADGRYSPLYQLAASLCLCAAAAAGVPALDTVHTDFKDAAGLAATSRASRRRGFRGRIAIHPDQVVVINEAYSPTADEVAHARRVVEAFAAQPEAGTLSLDGHMIDRPHLVQAQRTLAQLD
ncbi:MAG: CoA ester lyase [Rubrivivax sp.]